MNIDKITEANRLMEARTRDLKILEAVNKGEFHPAAIRGKFQRYMVGISGREEGEITLDSDDLREMNNHLISMLEARIERAELKLQAMGFEVSTDVAET